MKQTGFSVEEIANASQKLVETIDINERIKEAVNIVIILTASFILFKI
jgi:hypothetical protein